METHGLRSLTISGHGETSGGVYDEVSISGSGTVTGDIESGRIKVSGSARFEGNVKAEKLSVSGSLRAEQDAQAAEFRVSGSSRVEGNLFVERIELSGRLNVGGDVKARDAAISGSALCGADLEAERLRIGGAFDVAGTLSGADIEIALAGRSRATGIRGGRVDVQRSSWRRLPDFHRLWRPALLRAEWVEGEEVFLEATRAGAVRGRRVRIGPGCRIGSVEYGESLQIDPDSDVGRYAWTGREGAGPPVDRTPVEHAGGPHGVEPTRPVSRWRVWLGGREVDHPAARILAGALALLVIAAVLGVVVFVILPLVGLAVSLAVAVVLIALVGAAVGVPVLVVGAVIVKLALAPIQWIVRAFRDRSQPPM